MKLSGSIALSIFLAGAGNALGAAPIGAPRGNAPAAGDRLAGLRPQ